MTGGAGSSLAGLRIRPCPAPSEDVEGVPSLAVLDLDDPDVGIARDRAADIGVRLGLDDRRAVEGGEPGQAAVDIARLGEDAAAAVALVELEDDGAALPLAPAHHRRRDPVHRSAADTGADPELRRYPPLAHAFPTSAKTRAKIVSTRAVW